MSISLCRSRLCVTKQPADDRQAQAAAGADGRERMAQIINAGVFAEAGALPNEVPDVPERGQVLAWLVAGEYPLALALRCAAARPIRSPPGLAAACASCAAWCERKA